MCHGEAWNQAVRFQSLVLSCPKENKINSMNSVDVKKPQKPTIVENECYKITGMGPQFLSLNRVSPPEYTKYNSAVITFA